MDVKWLIPEFKGRAEKYRCSYLIFSEIELYQAQPPKEQMKVDIKYPELPEPELFDPDSELFGYTLEGLKDYAAATVALNVYDITGAKHDTDDSPKLDPDLTWKALADAGEIVPAIKMHRTQYGTSLKDAKNAVDAYRDGSRTRFLDRCDVVWKAWAEVGDMTAAISAYRSSYDGKSIAQATTAVKEYMDMYNKTTTFRKKIR